MDESPRTFDLDRWQRDFTLNTQRLDQLRLARNGKSAAEGWSASQCIEHLSLTASQYLAVWSEVALKPGVSEGSSYAFWWRWFLAGIANPEKLKARTTSSFEPVSGADLKSAIDRYTAIRDRVREVAMRIEQSQKGGFKVRSPFAQWMRYPADFSFDLWLAHEHRHLLQAETTVGASLL
jgi:hypothetical protein